MRSGTATFAHNRHLNKKTDSAFRLKDVSRETSVLAVDLVLFKVQQVNQDAQPHGNNFSGLADLECAKIIE